MTAFEHIECPNCTATLAAGADTCNRCGERMNEPGTGRPRFTEASRDAGPGLGGLLSLIPVGGVRVRYVGACPAGAFGVDAAGELVWTIDWGWVGKVLVDGTDLRLDGVRVELDTGRVLVDPPR